MATLRLVRSYDEVDNIRTFVFETGGETWQAGQYQTYELSQIDGSEDRWRHFFTIASAPSEGEIHISTRVTDSSFKQTLNAMKPGDGIEARDVEGDFLWTGGSQVVLVAAGIGVTPYRSMLIERHMTGESLSAHLLYYSRDKNFAFKKEFSELEKVHPELKISYISGEKVTASSILKHAPEAKDILTYISGPEAMVDTVGDQLKKKGVEIKQDWFPGYSEETF